MTDGMLRLVILFVLLGSIYTLSCPCWRDKNLKDSCKVPENCVAGITSDACGCCKVCAKALDEKCGGPWGTTGRCGEGLECIKSENLPPGAVQHAEGICKPVDSKKN